MKATLKSIGTVLTLIFLATVSNAQISIGLKGGVNHANISTANFTQSFLPAFKNNKSITYGAVVEYGITDAFAIQSELNFIKKGFVIREGIDLNLWNIPVPVGVKATTDLNYVEMPLLAKYKVGAGVLGAYIAAGPTFGYATGGKFKTSANFLVDINLVSTPINLDALNINRFEVGGAVGAGVTLNVGGSQLFVDGRYTHGFTKLDNLPIVDVDFKNKGFALTGGFLIPLGGGGRKL